MECLAEQRPQLGKRLASCDDDAGWRRGTAETRSVIPTQPTHIPTARAIKANKRKGVALGRPSIRPTPFAYSRLGRGIERCRVLLISPPISSLRPLWRSCKYSRGPQIASSSAALRTRGTGTTSAQQQEGGRRSPLKRWGGRQTPSGRSLISDVDVSSSHTVSTSVSAGCRLLRRKKNVAQPAVSGGAARAVHIGLIKSAWGQTRFDLDIGRCWRARKCQRWWI